MAAHAIQPQLGLPWPDAIDRCIQPWTSVSPNPARQGYAPPDCAVVSFRDPEAGKHLVFLTHLFEPPALTIAAIYQNCWQIELYFKGRKQNLAVKHFAPGNERP